MSTTEPKPHRYTRKQRRSMCSLIEKYIAEAYSTIGQIACVGDSAGEREFLLIGLLQHVRGIESSIEDLRNVMGANVPTTTKKAAT